MTAETSLRSMHGSVDEPAKGSSATSVTDSSRRIGDVLDGLAFVPEESAMQPDSRPTRQRYPDRSRLGLRSFCDGEMHVLKLAGELDVATADELERELRRVELTCVPVIAIDLRDLTWIDSIGLRLIIQAQQRSAQGTNRLVLLKGSDSVQRIFEICGVTHKLPFVEHPPRRADLRHSSPGRRASQAALAAAVRELRTYRRSDKPRLDRRPT
jgi:anti-sigma B factor antagonist